MTGVAHRAGCAARSAARPLAQLGALVVMGLVLPVFAVGDKDEKPVADAAEDLTQAALWKHSDGGLVFEIRARGAPMSDCIRILVADQKAQGDDIHRNATWMVEQGRLYARAADIPGWAWNEVMPVLSVAASNVWLVRIPRGTLPDAGAWLIETTRADGSVADVLPNEGPIRFVSAEIPDWKAPPPRSGTDLSDLFQQAPVSLSLRYETELKAARWQRISEPPRLAIFCDTNLSQALRVYLHDVERDETVECLFTSAWKSAEWLRWEGETLGLKCSARMSTNSPSGWRFDVFLESSEERRLEVTTALVLEGGNWTWFTEEGPVRLDGQDEEAIAAHTAAGETYPFGVVARGDRVWLLAVHPDEPRVFRIVGRQRKADTELAASCTVALTSATTGFPFRASLSLLWDTLECRTGDVFLAAAAVLHERGVLGGGRSMPGRWDVETWPRLRGYAELPLATGSLASGFDVDALLDVCAGLPDGVGEEAAVTRQGAVRGIHGGISLRHHDPDRSVCADWWLDPDMRVSQACPVSPAMYVWALMRTRIADPRGEGVALALPDLSGPQYDGAALGVADHPCCYDQDALRPLLHAGAGVFEFLQLASPKIRAAHKKLALELAGALDPFVLRFGDGFILAEPPADSARDIAEWLDHLRVIAGARPIFAKPDFWKRWAGEAECLSAALRWGVCPLGDAGPWSASFEPLLRRMAVHGWNPRASSERDGRNIARRVFGAPSGPHEVVLVAPNTQNMPVEHEMNAPQSWVLVNALNGNLQAGGRPRRLLLEPGETAAWLAWPGAHVEEAQKFFADWSRAWSGAGHMLENMLSWKRERAWGCEADVEWPHPVGETGRQRAVVRMRNIGKEPWKIEDIHLIGRVFWEAELHDWLPPGCETNMPILFDARGVPDDGWLEMRWKLEKQDGSSLDGVRWWRADIARAIEVVQRDDRLHRQSENQVAARFVLHNHTDEEQTLLVRWRGDFEGGRRTVTLAPRESRSVEVTVESGNARLGELFVILEQDEIVVGRLHYELGRFSDIGNSHD